MEESNFIKQVIGYESIGTISEGQKNNIIEEYHVSNAERKERLDSDPKIALFQYTNELSLLRQIKENTSTIKVFLGVILFLILLSEAVQLILLFI